MIDLRSDTVTKPTEAMRKAAYEAEVGDDVYGEDPSINQLEETAAEVLGKEAALFVTSGTQGNQIAILTHCRPGNEIILEAESHIFYYESGASSAFAGVQTRTLNGSRGAMDPSDVEYAIRGEDQHFPETGLVCLENTHNRAGGAVIPIDNMKEIHKITKANNVPVHMDGARLFNAAAALNLPASELAKHSDTVQVCLSKGLGAPVGSILAGNRDFITAARKWRKRLGGGLRQAGVIAAPGHIALTQMRERLAEDHENAQYLAQQLGNIRGIEIVNQVDTNIIVADVKNLKMNSSEFVERLKAEGVLSGTFGPSYVRFVTHYDVNRNQLEQAITAIQKTADQVI
ncbi:MULTISPECIES: low-specificity L-threonine aldolase [Bacillaceae]|uniref:low-specificity L-threonine aldolase n=1 Tax=Bacillaceae TaxID=186817 RepID=UPI000BA69647|nr:MULTISPECIES: low-specificity L-threonine aldolase [Bacillaceae]PAE26259.1 low-specificity L-threonine aldolase [Bacillus sp. 7894-2]URM31232.1 low-specificity L-threonine aldolase [Cytobacillus firmus]